MPGFGRIVSPPDARDYELKTMMTTMSIMGLEVPDKSWTPGDPA